MKYHIKDYRAHKLNLNKRTLLTLINLVLFLLILSNIISYLINTKEIFFFHSVK